MSTRDFDDFGAYERQVKAGLTALGIDPASLPELPDAIAKNAAGQTQLIFFKPSGSTTCP